jgi:hypothetical protein
VTCARQGTESAAKTIHLSETPAFIAEVLLSSPVNYVPTL